MRRATVSLAVVTFAVAGCSYSVPQAQVPRSLPAYGAVLMRIKGRAPLGTTERPPEPE